MKMLIPMLVSMLLLAPAIRLWNQARRTKQTPELWAALYFLGAGIGLPLRVFGSSIFGVNPELAVPVNIVGHLFFAFGTIAMTVFTWRVFHPGSARARAFGIATVVGILATTLYTFGTGLSSIEKTPAMIATNFARLIPTYWAFFESFRYWGAMRKRVPLGLADPVVANRFLLWSVWTCAVSVLPTIALSLRLVDQVAKSLGYYGTYDGFEEFIFLGLRLVFLVVGPIAAIALSLSFFPPTRYLDRIRSRAAASARA